MMEKEKEKERNQVSAAPFGAGIAGIELQRSAPRLPLQRTTPLLPPCWRRS